jgi:hypothetical protein
MILKFYLFNLKYFRLGNKQDKSNALDESEIVQLLDIEEIVNHTKTPCRVVRVFVK